MVLAGDNSGGWHGLHLYARIAIQFCNDRLNFGQVIILQRIHGYFGTEKHSDYFLESGLKAVATSNTDSAWGAKLIVTLGSVAIARVVAKGTKSPSESLFVGEIFTPD